ncbi:MAG: hypothetical protein JF588_08925 [Caulobacterales bacterium]|nr:hypothetical protein [Caulobacterales bacterium]
MTMERQAASVRRRAVLAMAVSVLALAGSARAQDGYGLVDLAVVDRDTGQALQVWRHGGRLFVAGHPGARYGLRVTNHTGGRVLVVMSVDGVNILTGQTADYGQTGYVFGPYESYDVTGWRKSDSEVAAFTFASLSNSYAARTGRPADVGVIGVAAFRERVVQPVAPLAASRIPVPAPPATTSPPTTSDRNSLSEVVVTGQRRAAPAREAEPAERSAEKLGTGHGAREWSVVTNVPFERATRYPQFITRIEYDTYDNLVASGVIQPRWDRGAPPRPFPGNPPRYVPDPPGGR